jgi:uridine kinase
MTILRDTTTTRSDFIFYIDRLSTLIVEKALSLLPTSPRQIFTGNGTPFTGVANCDSVSGEHPH